MTFYAIIILVGRGLNEAKQLVDVFWMVRFNEYKYLLVVELFGILGVKLGLIEAEGSQDTISPVASHRLLCQDCRRLHSLILIRLVEGFLACPLRSISIHHMKIFQSTTDADKISVQINM